MWFNFRERLSYSRKAVKFGHALPHLHRQDLIPGFDSEVLANAHVHLMGAGGIGSDLAHKLVRKGIGRLTITDPDYVDSTNLNRQVFDRRDVGKNKALATGNALKRIAINELQVDAFGLGFEDVKALGKLTRPDILVCGVDDMLSRAFACEYAHIHGIPMVSIAVDYTAETGVVFVQKPNQACFGCYNPALYMPRKAPCFAAASADILSVVNGFALRAIDSLLMPDLLINWNMVEAHVAGFMQTTTLQVGHNPRCPVCGHQSSAPSK